MTKSPVVGIVTHVSKRGTEVHLAGDPKRYRTIVAEPTRPGAGEGDG